MNRATTTLLLSTLLLLSLAPPVHAGFFGDIGGALLGSFGSGIGGFIDELFSNPVAAVGNVINNTFGGTSSSSPKSPTGNGVQNENNAKTSGGCTKNCTGINGQQPPGDTQPTNTYTKQPVQKFVQTNTTEDFSEITISSLELKPNTPSNEFFSGTYWTVLTNLTNQGTRPGTVVFRFTLQCQERSFTGYLSPEKKTLKQLDWIKYQNALGEGIPNGFEAPVVNTFWVDEKVLQYGGSCEFTAEIKDNVQFTKVTTTQTTIIQQILTIFGLGYKSSIDTQTQTETGTKTGDYAGGKVDLILTQVFEVKPRVPQLAGGANLGFGTIE